MNYNYLHIVLLCIHIGIPEFYYTDALNSVHSTFFRGERKLGSNVGPALRIMKI